MNEILRVFLIALLGGILGVLSIYALSEIVNALEMREYNKDLEKRIEESRQAELIAEKIVEKLEKKQKERLTEGEKLSADEITSRK